MKNIRTVNLLIALMSLLMLVLSCSTTKKVQNSLSSKNLIIYYDPNIGNDNLLKATEEYGAKILYIYKNFSSIAISIPEQVQVQNAIKFFNNVNGVISVTEDSECELH